MVYKKGERKKQQPIRINDTVTNIFVVKEPNNDTIQFWATINLPDNFNHACLHLSVTNYSVYK